MTPQEFVNKWKGISQKERSVAQTHFNDLCDLLDEPKPLDVDPDGTFYAFEKGATKTTGGDGWADVWRENCFAWEYKGKHKDLDKAYAQIQKYAVALNNPPLLIVCDIERIRIVTNWTNHASTTHEITLEDLLNPDKRTFLKLAFQGSEQLRSKVTREQLTKIAAQRFATLAYDLEKQGHDPLAVAHFVNRLVFCLFAEDVKILPNNLFSELLQASTRKLGHFEPMAKSLFGAMREGGIFGSDEIAWFNGGLFDSDATIPLGTTQIEALVRAAKDDWGAIDPAIFGTLFERGLDPAKRAQLGAHYTDPQNIMRIIDPVVLDPLRKEWAEAYAEASRAKDETQKQIIVAFLDRLRAVRVLDPACGSGNFLYLVLRGLKDLEHLVLIEAWQLGHKLGDPQIGPEAVLGIELSPYAAELARVSVWIGHLQWQLEHGYEINKNPVLKSLETIENKDALLSAEGADSEWPRAEFIVGNPPFLGSKLLRWSSKDEKHNLGDEYVDELFGLFKDRVPRESDLCVYWFEKAREQIQNGKCRRVGLIATQGIRGGANRKVLDRIKESGDIFLAWGDLGWVLDGAAVHVSIIGFDGGVEYERLLDGKPVLAINANLTSGADLSLACRLSDNIGKCFMGTTSGGRFDIDDQVAIGLLTKPNPNGKPNSDVVRPWSNARILTSRSSSKWIIDFPVDSLPASLALYEEPFAILEAAVKSMRSKSRTTIAGQWWLQERRRGDMRLAIEGLSRFIVTNGTGKHRLFAFYEPPLIPDHALFVYNSGDDYNFGVLHSRFHEIWALSQGTQLREKESGFRYTPTTCFETFPFPNPTGAQREAISETARELNHLRETWLNPPEWTQSETLIFPATVGGPWNRWIPNADTLDPGTITDAQYVRTIPKLAAKKMVAERTLTALYNKKPAWLRNAHEKLDKAVAEAYGLPWDMSEQDLLAELLSLNLAQAERG